MRRRSGNHLRGVFKRHKRTTSYGGDIKPVKSDLFKYVLPMNTQTIENIQLFTAQLGEGIGNFPS